jgi:hypothetical protein
MFQKILDELAKYVVPCLIACILMIGVFALSRNTQLSQTIQAKDDIAKEKEALSHDVAEINEAKAAADAKLALDTHKAIDDTDDAIKNYKEKADIALNASIELNQAGVTVGKQFDKNKEI